MVIAGRVSSTVNTSLSCRHRARRFLSVPRPPLKLGFGEQVRHECLRRVLAASACARLLSLERVGGRRRQRLAFQAILRLVGMSLPKGTELEVGRVAGRMAGSSVVRVLWPGLVGGWSVVVWGG